MKQVNIRSGMHNFILLDRIFNMSRDRIIAGKVLRKEPLFTGIEALAQAGALHTRYINDFDRHSFLLKIRNCTILTSRELNGEFLIRGELTARSAASFSYRLQLEKKSLLVMGGDFLFGTVEYDSRFRKDILDNRYRKIFSCLLTGIKPD